MNAYFLKDFFFNVARIKRNRQEKMTPNHKGIAVCGKVQTQNEIVFLQNFFFFSWLVSMPPQRRMVKKKDIQGKVLLKIPKSY